MYHSIHLQSLCLVPASRMDFIRTLCQETFTDALIIYDLDPSYCVSRGLAYAGKTDLEALASYQVTRQKITKLLSEKIVQEMPSKIITALSSDLEWQVVYAAFDQWASGSENKTPRQLCTLMSQRFSDLMTKRDLQVRLSSLFIQLIQSQQGEINRIINEQFRSLYKQTVPPGYHFTFDNQILILIRQTLSKFKIELNSSDAIEAVNASIGLWGWGYVQMDWECPESDRRVKADRVLNRYERRIKVVRLLNQKVQESLQSQLGTARFNQVAENVVKLMTPQLRELVNGLALYFADCLPKTGTPLA